MNASQKGRKWYNIGREGKLKAADEFVKVTDMTIGVKSIEPIVGELDIDESYIRQCDALLLETLLIDRTMTAENGGDTINIKWAGVG